MVRLMRIRTTRVATATLLPGTTEHRGCSRQLGLTGGRLTRSLLRRSDEMETTQNIPWTLTQTICLRGIGPYFL
jgi:hypothetical protein